MRVIADRYELVAFVGRGGMGEVWEGRDQVIGRRVAVKLLPDQKHGTAADLFFREARTAGGLNHRGVVTIHDLGRDPRDDTLYLVMEYVAGRNLADVLHADGPPPPATSVEWAAQTAAALAAAHEAGVVHRDLKPANLMLTGGGEVKVLDFGIARFMAATDKASQVMGTLAYMAPERFAEHSGDARSDLYAFGCVLHELLTGETPFRSGDPASVMMAHLNKAPDAPSSLRAGLPVGLDALVLRLLAKEPADRPQSAAAVHDELRSLDLASVQVRTLTERAPAAPSRPSTAPATAPAAPGTPPAPAGPPPYGPSTPGQPPAAHQLPTQTAAPFVPGTTPVAAGGPAALSRRRALLLGLGGATALAVGGTALATLRTGGDKAPPKPKVQPWQHDVKENNNGNPTKLTVADSILYVATSSTVIALDARTGGKRWDGPSDFSPQLPAVADGTVYVGGLGGDEGLWALDAHGRKKWTFPSTDLVGSRPAVSGGIVYFSSRDKYVYAVHTDSGRKVWSHPLGDKISCSPTVADGTVYIGCGGQDKALYALDAASGAKKWAFPVGYGFTTGGTVNPTPVVSGGLVYAIADDQTLYAIHADRGTKKWSVPLEGQSLHLAGDTLYVGSGNELGLVHALDPSTGNKKWTLENDHSTPISTQLAVAGGLVFVGDTMDPEGTIHAFDTDDGSKRWSTPTSTGQSKQWMGDDVVTAYGFVYVATAAGVVALDAATGKAPAPVY
ncbi:serine/threonine-protein kinase [Streptomyces yunnanensis]|uniref:non-specific serine/threonine protein kinase n=1 Tax=Streptomyces yunnanensis TaxID=156453 RepID=A0A9X8N8N8_9ACTN|nr:serine/threonine-protein kinase [Streptomyces yunnanensis]SHN29476.1 serine/threonine protein kinase [Streptomyces yunnanensis]